MGDSVQIIKAGLMEIADVFVINKADREGALALEKDLYTLLSLVDSSPEAWKPRIAQTVATTGSGVEKIVEVAGQHRTWLETSSRGYARRLKVVSQTIVALASEWIAHETLRGTEKTVDALARECIGRSKTPIEAVEALVSHVCPKRG
jgi:LAO/AO transport system kinase